MLLLWRITLIVNLTREPNFKKLQPYTNGMWKLATP